MTDQELTDLIAYMLEPAWKETYVGNAVRRLVDEVRSLRAQVAAQVPASATAINTAADAAVPTTAQEESVPQEATPAEAAP